LRFDYRESKEVFEDQVKNCDVEKDNRTLGAQLIYTGVTILSDNNVNALKKEIRKKLNLWKEIINKK
jgi:hypothetical protein